MDSSFTLLGFLSPETLGSGHGLVAEARERLLLHHVGSGSFGSGGDCSGTTAAQIVAPQHDGEGDDGEPGYNDCPRLSTKPLEPLCVKLNRTEDCCGGDDPTAVVARRPSPNGDDDDRPADDERDLRYMEVGGTPSLLVRPQ